MLIKYLFSDRFFLFIAYKYFEANLWFHILRLYENFFVGMFKFLKWNPMFNMDRETAKSIEETEYEINHMAILVDAYYIIYTDIYSYIFEKLKEINHIRCKKHFDKSKLYAEVSNAFSRLYWNKVQPTRLEGMWRKIENRILTSESKEATYKLLKELQMEVEKLRDILVETLK